MVVKTTCVQPPLAGWNQLLGESERGEPVRAAGFATIAIGRRDLVARQTGPTGPTGPTRQSPGEFALPAAG